ncbi:S8 family serine peptidase [candidate division WOR-3 bacterium]|nr:S8 family serine peptidase [candidate division WOR-3 bacterium]
MFLSIVMILGITQYVADELVIKADKLTAEQLKHGDITALLPAGVEIERLEPLFPGMHTKNGGELLDRCFRLKLSRKEILEPTIAKLKALPGVEDVQPIAIHEFDIIPNDPMFPDSQWYLHQTTDHDIDAPEAWDTTIGSNTVVVAVVETGVQYTHEDLVDNIWDNPDEIPNNGVDDDANGYVDDTLGWDFVDGQIGSPWWPGEDSLTEDNEPLDFNGHGTHVAGIIGAVTNNNIGVAGVNWDVKIMCLRVGGSVNVGGQERGLLRTDWAAKAIVYAVDEGAHIVNCSFGTSATGGLPYAVWYAAQNGVLIVHAAGNDDSETADYFGERDEILNVAATNSSDQKASFSNYGDWVDVSAPGTYIYSTYSRCDTIRYCDTGYTYKSGTSMATPVVAGIAALVKARQPSWTSKQLYARVYGMVDTIDHLNPGYEGKLGAGRINAYYAVNFASAFNPQIDADTIRVIYTYTPKATVIDSIYNHTYYRDRRSNSWATPNYYVAAKLTPRCHPCTVDSIEIRFRVYNGEPSDSDTVFIWVDSGGEPGTLLRSVVWDIPASSGWYLQTVRIEPPVTIDTGSFWAGYRVFAIGNNKLKLVTDTSVRYPVEGINKYSSDRQTWYTFTSDGKERDFIITAFVRYGGKTDSGWVKNVGNFTLRVASSETQDTNWIIGWQPRRFEIEPGESLAIHVEVDTTLSDGTYSGSITLYTNDPDDNPFLLPVKYTVSPVGIAERVEPFHVPQLVVYPAIGVGVFHIKYSVAHKCRLTVYDVVGRKLYSIPVERTGSHVWRVSNDFKPGVYFIHLEGTRLVSKIILLR